MNFKQFLTEISKKELESIKLDRELHFNNIFGDKLRVLIPLEGNKELKEFSEKLQDLGYEVDYQDLINKKLVYKKIKTKEGTKTRPEKVGGILQSFIKNYDKIKDSSEFNISFPSKVDFQEMLDWWQKNSAYLKTGETGSSIIISRSPIDLVRMSDHDGISSCHSPEGSYFKCAIQEAKTGGAIAYVVKNSDLKGVDIQQPEIFEDKQRKVSGIVPLERLRLRRFIGKDVDVLLPELRTYGIKNIGFLDTVISWAKSSQKDSLNKIDPEEDYDSFDLAGGSYQDTRADRIWSDFFDKKVHGGKESIHSDEEEEGEHENLDSAAERQLEAHKRNWKHIDVYYDIYDNILDYRGYAGFSIPKKLFNVNPFDRKVDKKIISLISNEIDISGIENLEVEEYKDQYLFNFNIIDDNDYERNQLTRFEHFLDYIDEVDAKYPEIVNKVYISLISQGYLKNIQDKIEFTNFSSEVDEDGTTISSDPEKVGFLKDFPVEDKMSNLRPRSSTYSSNEIYGLENFREILLENINKLKIFPFSLKSSEFTIYVKRGETQGLLEKTQATSGSSETGRRSWVPSFHFLTGWVYFEINKIIDLKMMGNKDLIKKIVHVDKNFDFYVSKLARLFENIQKSMINQLKSRYPNIRDVSKDPLYHQILSPISSAIKPSDIKLQKKPTFVKSTQKQFKFESFCEWIIHNKFKHTKS